MSDMPNLDDDKINTFEGSILQYGALPEEVRRLYSIEASQLFATLTYLVNKDGVRATIESGEAFRTSLRDIAPEYIKALPEPDFTLCLFSLAMEAVSVSRMEVLVAQSLIKQMTGAVLGDIQEEV